MYSQLAPSALTELTQFEEETELDDAVYDDQEASNSTRRQQGSVGAESGSALSALNAGPFQATVDAEVPAAAAAASQITEAAGHLTSEQLEDGILASSTLPDSLATLATAASAVTAADAAGPKIDNATGPPGLQTEALPGTAAEQDSANLIRQPEEQGHKAQAAFCPARVVKKKYVLPPKVDHRWGPVKLCEKWVFRMRGYRNANKPEDDGALEEEEGKEQAQLNQQEGRATGVYCQKQKSNRERCQQSLIKKTQRTVPCIKAGLICSRPVCSYNKCILPSATLAVSQCHRLSL